MRNKILILLGIIMLVTISNINTATAIELNPFAETKIVIKNITDDTPDFLVSGFNPRYGIIRLTKTFFWFPTDKIAEYSLVDNTEIECLIECSANGKAVLYEDGTLFEDTIIKTERGNVISTESKYYIKGKENYSVTIPSYAQLCGIVKDEDNGTVYNRCENILLKTKQENLTRDIWIPYNNEILKAGNYEWKFIGKKHPAQTLDFIPIKGGKELTDWAWWNASWGFKKLITVTPLYNTTNGTIFVNVTWNSNIKQNFSDIRFTNGNETAELDYWIESQINNVTAGVWVRIPTTISVGTNTSIYMYYGNPNANTTSNGNKTFFFFDSFETLDLSRWTNNAGYSINNNSYLQSASGDGNTYTAGGTYDNFIMTTRYMITTGIAANFYGPLTRFTAGNGYLMDYESGTSILYQYPAFGTVASSATLSNAAVWNYHSNMEIGSNISATINQANSYNLSTGLIISGINAVYSNGGLGFRKGGGAGFFLVDFLFIRNYTAREPTLLIGAEQVADILSVVLTNPINGANLSTSTGQTFNATATSTAFNATRYLYTSGGALISTNFTTAITAGNKTNFSMPVLADGTYLWNIQMCGNDGLCLFAPANFTFTIDSTSPIVTIVSPINATYIYSGNASNTQYNLNITAPALGLSTIYYYTSYDPTIRFVTNGALNVINLTNIFGEQTIFAFANDTVGNIGSSTANVIFPKVTYNLNASILTSQTFILNSSYFNGATATGIAFNYNGSVYFPVITFDGAGNTIATSTLILPVITGIVPFYWNTTLSTGQILNSSIYNQTVSAFTLDGCAVNTNLILNFTNYDQDTLVQLQNNTFNIQVRIGDANMLNYIQYSNVSNSSLNLQVCMNTNLTSTYRMEVLMQWNRNASYYTQFYNIQNFTLTQATANRNISLYNLLQSSGSICPVNVKDANFNNLENYLVQVDRQYIAQGTFLTTEIPATDAFGNTVTHLVLNNQLYNVYITHNGQNISQFLNIQPINDPITGSCALNFQTQSPDTVPTTPNVGDNIIYTLFYDDVTQTYTINYQSINGTAITVMLNGSIGGTQVCSGIQTASSGSVSCVIPAQYQNQTVTIQGFSNGNLIFTDYVNVGFTFKTNFLGKGRFLLAGLLIPAAVLMAAGSPALAIIMFVFGLGVSAFIFLVDTQSIIGAGSFIVWFAIAAIILLIKIAKGGQKNG